MAIHRKELKTTDHLTDRERCPFPLPPRPTLHLRDGKIVGNFYGKKRVRESVLLAANSALTIQR